MTQLSTAAALPKGSGPGGAPDIVLAAGVRSPWARAGGAFRGEDAGHLGARVARELLARTALDPSAIDEVIVGCVGPPHDQANVGRVIALRAGVPRAVPARTVGRNCASGMDAVTSAVMAIRAGEGELYLTMGVEVMSAYPLIYGPKMTRLFEGLSSAKGLGARLATLAKFRPSFLKPRIALMEGLTDPISGLIMGSTAELLARDFGLTRAECDRYALQSHQRAARARDKGRFEREIVPILPLGAKPGQDALLHDDSIRDELSLEKLGRLKPYFEKPDGVVTVGNACGITDGASALIITTTERAKQHGLTPLARIKGYAWTGCDPARMGLGPVYATARVLDATGVKLSDIGHIEINEAFAAQVLACQRAFESDSFGTKELCRTGPLGPLDMTRVNVNGGAIALGHPVGATGARLVLTAAHELSVGDHELALATLCIGGGQGGAMLLERISA
jgi:acetyl-CoA C-acetyltransferase/acetyl-CoA acyltransferase